MSEGPPSFDIGVVYSQGGKYFLAVSSKLLISFNKGELVERRPLSHYDVIRTVSVEELCRRWGITLEELDAELSKYIIPSCIETKHKRKGRGRGRKNADEQVAFWQNLRRVKGI